MDDGSVKSAHVQHIVHFKANLHSKGPGGVWATKKTLRNAICNQANVWPDK